MTRTRGTRRPDPRFSSVTDEDWLPKAAAPGEPDPPRGEAKYGAIPTRAELARRVEAVATLLIYGNRRAHVQQWASSRTDWDLTPRTVDTYIAKATREIEAGCQKRIKFRTAQTFARYDEMFRRASEAGQLNIALRAAREHAKLLSLAKRITPWATREDEAPTTPPEQQPAGAALSEMQRADTVMRWIGVARSRGANVPAVETDETDDPQRDDTTN